MISGKTKVFGLVGHPVGRSLSPAMHNELFRRRGVDAVYVAFEVHPEQASTVAVSVRTLGLAGVNLTVPFKERVLPDLDALSPEAEAAGAVNVVVNRQGRLVGYNTDGVGYLRALLAEMGEEVAGRDLAVFGAGGTGRAVAAAAAEAGVRNVTLYNRTLARAEAAIAALSQRFPQTGFRALLLDPEVFAAEAGDHEILVNCTATGASFVGFDVGVLHRGRVWTDTNYYLADPPLLAACVRRGLRVQQGIGMLMQQGAATFELFTGVPVDVGAVRGVLDIGGW